MPNTTKQAEILKTWPNTIYVSHMMVIDDGKPYEEHLHQRIFCVANEPNVRGDNVKYIRVDLVNEAADLKAELLDCLDKIGTINRENKFSPEITRHLRRAIEKLSKLEVTP